MELTTCRMCGNIFNHVRGQLICQSCRNVLEDKFKEAKDYLYKNPKAGIRELAQHCDVPPSQINRWIREERLSFTDDSPITLNCEKCGAAIRTGRYCQRCKNDLSNGINEVAGFNPKPMETKKKEKKSNKMRFLDSDS